jgi:hypothetical protein
LYVRSPCFFGLLGLAPSPLSLHPLQPCSPEAQLNHLNLNTTHPVTLLNPYPADISSFNGTITTNMMFTCSLAVQSYYTLLLITKTSNRVTIIMNKAKHT